MEINSDNVEHALREFYKDPSRHAELHCWLTSLYSSAQAWSICWQLLEPCRSAESQYFGASLLHAKISRAWGELEVEHYDELRLKLMSSIKENRLRPRPAQTKICVALAAYILHSTPTHWPNSVQEVVTWFQPDNFPQLSSEDICSLLLDVLTVIPEEFSSTHHLMEGVRKGEIRSELVKASQHVLPLLQSLLTSTSTPPTIKGKCVRVGGAWLSLGLPLTDCLPLAVSTLQALTQPDTFDEAIETSIIIFSHPESHNYPNVVKYLLPSVTSICSQLIDAALKQEDMDSCHSIFRLLVSLGEQHSRLLAEWCLTEPDVEPHVIHFISLILQCSSIPGHYPVDETCSSLPFGFWYILQDDILAFDSQPQSSLLTKFGEHFLTLTDVLLRKSQYPPMELYHNWSAEDKELFRCYRQDISDTVMYEFSVLRVDLLKHLVMRLEQSLHNVTNSTNNNSSSSASQDQDAALRACEACIYLLDAVGDALFDATSQSIQYEIDHFITVLFHLLTSSATSITNTLATSTTMMVSTSHSLLLDSTLLCIGTYAEWMCDHPNVLESVLPVLIQGLQSPTSTLSASISLKCVTRECSADLLPHASTLLSACHTLLLPPHPSTPHTPPPRLPQGERVRLMGAVGHLISPLPPEQGAMCLDEVISPHLALLQHLLSASDVSSSVRREGLLDTLSLISMLVMCLDTKCVKDDEEEDGAEDNKPQLILLLLPQLYSYLTQISNAYPNDGDLSEAIVDIFKKSLSTLQDDLAPLLSNTLNLVMHMYEVRPQGCILELLTQIFIIFSSSTSHPSPHLPILTSVFHHISFNTFTLYGINVSSYLREHPDIVESFLNMNSQILKKRLPLFSGSTDHSLLLRFGIFGLTFPESHTLKAAALFLVEFMMRNPDKTRLEQALEKDGENLIVQLLKNIAGASPRSLLDIQGQVMFALARDYLPLVRDCLVRLAQLDGFPSPRVTRGDKEIFTSSILREKANKRRLQENIAEFSLKCRGLFGTEYANSTPISLT